MPSIRESKPRGFLKLRLRQKRKLSPCIDNRLPTEIILVIMGLLLSDYHHPMLPFKHLDPFIQSFWDWRRSELPNVARLAATQDLLFRLALLGKAWYSVAMTFLYARPFLRSPYQVRCLRRTLERSSLSGSMIFSLVVMSPGRDRVKSPYRWCSDAVKEARVRQDINIIFELCTTEDHVIESILLSTAPELPYIPYAPIKLVPEVLRQEWPLRKLVVNGCADHTWFGKVNLPQLEVLHLRCYVFNRFSTFPFLPRLTTVELVQCYFSQQARFFFGGYYCPSLRSLGYYQCSFLGREYPFLLRYLPPLEMFCFVEESRKSPILFDMIHRSQSVDHLVIGMRFCDRSIYLPRCRLPEPLKSLTIVALRGPRKCPVEDLLECLKYNFSWERGLASLRLIRMMGHIRATPTFDSLCSFCARHEIEVVYEGEGVAGWIQDRLDNCVPTPSKFPSLRLE